MIFLNIGEPDFTAPPLVQAAAEQAIPRRAHAIHPGHWGCSPCANASASGMPDRFGLTIARTHRGHRRCIGRAALACLA
jgi:aspartate/methionine/tyrosine aminotransferase